MKRRVRFLVPLFSVLAFGCGGGSGDSLTPPPPSSPHVSQGWFAFEIGDFATAASEFQKAIDINNFDAAAHNGLGFANMKLDRLPQSLASFNQAIANGFVGADPHAGKAILLRDIDSGDYAGAIMSAKTALAKQPTYTFAHDSSLDWKDLRLVLAQSYFALAQYSNANAEVAVLGGRVQDEQSPTFIKDLLKEIQRLGHLIGS